MKSRFLFLCLSVIVSGGSLVAGTLSVSATAPTVDGVDIAQLNAVGHSDPGGDLGHIWSNRPLQGQTFTTGANPDGYLLHSVTLRNEENTVNNSTATFEVRIGTVAGTVFTLVGTETSVNPVSYVPNDYMTFNYDTPITLLPNTVYGFMWDTSGAGFTTWNNANTNYAGGEGFSSGAGGVPDDNNLVFRGIDREFHLDLEVVVGDDNDGDGLPNQWEIDNGLDPESAVGDDGATGDPDMDGADNSRELLNGTDPQDNDSDDDGLLDGVESNTGVFVDAADTGSNPLNTDTDGDTLDDYSEVTPNPFVTDPNRTDTDGDGLDDAAELAADPFVTDPTNADTDGDGFSDSQEIAGGSDPTDANSKPNAPVMSVGSVEPVVDGEDIASLTGLTDIGGNQGHAWSNRPRQGQSFMTGAASGGYVLNAITTRVQVNQVSTLSANWEFRIGTLDGSEILTPLATYTVAGVTIPQSTAATGFTSYVTWTFGVPFPLEPNTKYGFDVFPDGGGFISLGEATDVYPGGSAYSAGSPGSAVYPASPPNPVTNHASDRHFHLDISEAGPALRLLDVERFEAPGGESVRLTWESRPGKKYAIDAGTDLETWDSSVIGEFEAAGAVSIFEELVASLPLGGPEVFFRVRELVTPPALSADFEGGLAGWTTGSIGAVGTAWELGEPASPGPAFSNSPTNCWGTNLTANYADDANIFLRSPSFDLTSAGSAVLTWYQWVDIDSFGTDAGSVAILNATDDSELAVIEPTVTGFADTWTRITRNIPAAALGNNVKLEFRFVSDDDTFTYGGWYIDDVEVTTP